MTDRDKILEKLKRGLLRYTEATFMTKYDLQCLLRYLETDLRIELRYEDLTMDPWDDSEGTV